MGKHGRAPFPVLAFPLLLASVLAAQAVEPQPSDTCGACHRDIYRMWLDSAHAQALEDPFFLEPLHRVEAAYGKSRAAKCIGCHAPMAVLTGDLELTKAVSREGVNCDFCHSLVAVEVDERGPSHKIDIGEVKRGTIPGADSRGHEVAYSELHKDSLVCAPCHEYTTEAGTAIMSTYTEWQASSSAERGETCQTCHMSLVDSNVVDPRIKRDSGAQVNLHQMPGGHSLQQLHKALKVSMKSERVERGGIEISTKIRNGGAGHSVPTGMPGRRIILRVEVRTSTGETYVDERVFEKRFLDGSNNRLVHAADLFFADGLRLDEDTRIGADEVRKETFWFPLPDSATAWVNLSLKYEHEPWGGDQERVGITFFSERRFVRRAS